MIFHRLAVLQGLFGRFPGNPAARASAHAMGRRWSHVMAKYPDLQADLAQLGGVYAAPPVQMMADGLPAAAEKSAYQCGREDGRRELALQLLALGGLTHEHLNQLMEDDDDD